MYLAPFLGMGVGYALFLMNDFLKKVITSGYLYRFITVVLILMTAFFTTNSNAFVYKAKPTVDEDFMNVIKDLKNILDRKAYIWQWWDYGSIVEFHLRMGTFIDNHSFHPVKLYFFANSIMMHDEFKSRNLIAFVTNNLFKDYHQGGKMEWETLKKIRNQALNYKEPLYKKVYVFIYPEDINKNIIIELGIQGIKKYLGKTSLRRAFFKCVEEDQVYNCGKVEFDKFFTVFHWKDGKYEKENPYKKVIYIDLDKKGQIFKKILYTNEENSARLVLHFIRHKNDMYFLALDKRLSSSILNRMIIADKNLECFKPVYIGFPVVNVYEVINDKNCHIK